MNNIILNLLLFFVILHTNAQKKLITFSAESGGILPIPIFYKGINASSNSDFNITGNLGFQSQVMCNFNYNQKSYLSVGLFFESFSVNIKDYGRYPNMIDSTGFIYSDRSYFYSNFDSKNIGIKVGFGNSIGAAIKLNTGFQYGFPLNRHHGYIFLGTSKKIVQNFNYETKNPFSIFANVAWRMYEAKKYDLVLVPEFVFQINKDDKTYIHLNQIRKMYFALRIGISFK